MPRECIRRTISQHLSLKCALLVVGVVTGSLPAADADLESRLKPLIDAHKGKVSVAVRHLETGRSYGVRGDEPMPTASLIKLPVMVEAYRQAAEGKLDLNARLTLKADDKVPGSGILTPHFMPGMTLTIKDAIRLMIAYSDNTATNLILDQIGLPATSAAMEQLGLHQTRLHAKVFRAETSIAPERSQRFGLGSTSANDMLALLELLHQRNLVSREASEEMLAHLYQCDDRARFPRYLPEGTKVAHKTGSVAAVRTAAGILDTPGGHIALCVLTAENTDQRWVDDNAGNRLCAEIARVAYDVFNPVTLADRDTPRGELKLGDAGELVQALQRTLNTRLKPSPNLTADGDFGPATEAALQRFQREQNLEANGQVVAAVWSALGPLALGDTPVADPEVVNAEKLETKPADPLDGPPFVTCRAWAVADGKTGQVLWSSADDQKLEMASTTKIMSAYVALQLAAKDPKLLDEPVTFSKTADETQGSSSDLRAGESLPLRTLLYGLLLPSGNDAATAIAEHLGSKFPATEQAKSNIDRFVAAMNAEAAKLELNETRFVNPHGLPDKSHVSSARDLARLTHAALKLPEFRDVVRTRKFGVQVSGKGGYRRNVVWENTNQLLGIEGYSGVKTGTTKSAGACLVSLCQRDDDQLIIVLLGSPTNDSRYVDARNLFRWAWLKRGHKP